MFVQVLRLCQKARMVRSGNGALDADKIGANAYKRKLLPQHRLIRRTRVCLAPGKPVPQGCRRAL